MWTKRFAIFNLRPSQTLADASQKLLLERNNGEWRKKVIEAYKYVHNASQFKFTHRLCRTEKF